MVMYVFSEARESRECARLCTCFQRPEKAGSVLGYVFSEAREGRECARLCACFQRPEKAERECARLCAWFCGARGLAVRNLKRPLPWQC